MHPLHDNVNAGGASHMPRRSAFAVRTGGGEEEVEALGVHASRIPRDRLGSRVMTPFRCICSSW